jgi:hypothetical protein
VGRVHTCPGMRLRRRVTVTVEKREISISASQTVREQAYCERCGREVTMLSVALAASLAGVSERLLYQRVEAGQAHFVERPNGLLLICSESLGEKNR